MRRIGLPLLLAASVWGKVRFSVDAFRILDFLHEVFGTGLAPAALSAQWSAIGALGSSSRSLSVFTLLVPRLCGVFDLDGLWCLFWSLLGFCLLSCGVSSLVLLFPW